MIGCYVCKSVCVCQPIPSSKWICSCFWQMMIGSRFLFSKFMAFHSSECIQHINLINNHRISWLILRLTFLFCPFEIRCKNYFHAFCFFTLVMQISLHTYIVMTYLIMRSCFACMIITRTYSIFKWNRSFHYERLCNAEFDRSWHDTYLSASFCVPILPFGFFFKFLLLVIANWQLINGIYATFRNYYFFFAKSQHKKQKAVRFRKNGKTRPIKSE